jgi:hypothetical protein
MVQISDIDKLADNIGATLAFGQIANAGFVQNETSLRLSAFTTNRRLSTFNATARPSTVKGGFSEASVRNRDLECA